MLPRECDNDDCEEETGVDSVGRPRVWWAHVEGCGPMEFPDLEERCKNAPDGSFLAYMLGRK